MIQELFIKKILQVLERLQVPIYGWMLEEFREKFLRVPIF